MRGGAGAGRSTKKIFAQGKIKLKKIHARQLILKKYLCYGLLWPKKNSYREFDNEKKFLRLENSPPPPNFSNGPSLTFSLNSTPRQYGQFLRPPQWRGFTVQAAED